MMEVARQLCTALGQICSVNEYHLIYSHKPPPYKIRGSFCRPWQGYNNVCNGKEHPGNPMGRDAWKEFLVLARLKDKYERPVFPSGAAHVAVRCEALLVCAFLVYLYKILRNFKQLLDS